jgi:hypothetical protein
MRTFGSRNACCTHRSVARFSTRSRARNLLFCCRVIELEIARVLPDMAERAVGVIKRELSLLRQLSGHNLTVTAPSTLAIEDLHDEHM